MASRPPGQTDDLTSLENLTEKTLLEELKVRYRVDNIYTYVGEIVCAVNPFKNLPAVYGPQMQEKYKNIKDKTSKPPHIYALSDLSFAEMLHTKKAQVCVISGESGAGKTESAKLFVQQVVYVARGAEFEGLEKRLIQVNPLLEAFGNAKTGMNNNSSRFGKFISIRFNKEGSIKGAVMTDYILEKSRVCKQGENEQNFHIFYLFFSGMTSSSRSLYEVSNPDQYRYINSNEDALDKISSPDMKSMYQELMDCLRFVGFTEQQIEDLFHMISGILALGDFEFEGRDQAKITTDMAVACNQLGLEEGGFEQALTKQTLIINGEDTEQAYGKIKAEDCRDATAKAIYGRAFSWIVEQCNVLLGPRQKEPAKGDSSIGILDIFGFEKFLVNSFEQLCINLANEQLQFFFNEHIFAMEIAEYKKEGIEGKDIKYKNNEGLLALILSTKPLGLFAILDESSGMASSKDETFVEKAHAILWNKANVVSKDEDNNDYVKPKGNEARFGLKHYAGTVMYDADGFLEKNRDTLPLDVISALRLSENALIKEIFGGDEEGGGAAGPGQRKPAAARKKMDRTASTNRMRASMKHARAQAAKKQKITQATKFKVSLEALMVELKSAVPHFVRCVKPNMAKQCNSFDDELVTTQLRYTGMLETTRIRKEGYASRPLFQDFIDRYKILAFPMIANPAINASSCRRILDKATELYAVSKNQDKKKPMTGFEVGITKVFLRWWHADNLNMLLLPYDGAAVTLARYVKAGCAKSKYKVLLAEKRRQDAEVEKFIVNAEKNGNGMQQVVTHLNECDEKRPKSYWNAPVPAPMKPAQQTTLQRNAGGGGVSRSASVKWFKEVEKKKGAGIGEGGAFLNWFHGIITRADADSLLQDKKNGTFLIRVAESRFGYSLSLNFNGKIKHFMIDQNKDAVPRYIVVGNDRTFPTLNDIVAFHGKNPVTDEGDYLLYGCEGIKGRADLAELL